MSETQFARLSVQVVTTSEGLAELRPFWEKWNYHPDADYDSYSLVVAARHEVVSPYVLAVRENGRLKAILIGRLEKSLVPVTFGYFQLAKLAIRRIVFLHRGFLGEAELGCADALIGQLMSDLKRDVADCVLFEHLETSSDLHHLAGCRPNFFCRDRFVESRVRWKAAVPVSLEKYLNGRSQSQRWQLRRAMRTFENGRANRIGYDIFRTREDAPAFRAAVDRIVSKTYQTGLGVGFKNSTEDRRRMELSAEKGWLKGYTVSLDGEPVAFCSGRLYNGTMYGEWTGYDSAFKELEPGTVVFLKMVEDLCRSGVREIDFGPGDASYKRRLGDRTVSERPTTIFAPTSRGVVLNCFMSIEVLTNRLAKYVARKIKFSDAIKRFWRNRKLRALRKATPITKPVEPSDSEPEVETQRLRSRKTAIFGS